MGVEKYPEAMEFILHWGEMGTHWGANRSMAQVHALLYLSNEPLDAEAICKALNLARSNVSNSLKELQSYGIVKRTHIAGDRRDHFVAETELWDLFMAITAEPQTARDGSDDCKARRTQGAHGKQQAATKACA